MLRLAAGFFTLYLLLGCTKPAGLPTLPDNGSNAISQIVLTDRLSVSDVRGIFRALNKTGSLDGLKPYIEEPSDSELQDIIDLFSKYLYEDAFSPDGLVTAIQNRTNKRFFSDWNRRVTDWSKEKTFGDEIDTVRFVAQNTEFPNLATRFSPLLDPTWSKIATTALVPPSRPTAAEGPKISYGTQDWAGDFLTFLNSPTGIADTQTLTTSLERYHMVESAVRAMRYLGTSYTPSVFGDLGFAFRQFLLAQPTDPGATHQLEQLLLFLNTLNGPPNGLFKSFADNVTAAPELLDIATQTIEPWIENVVVDVMKQRIVANGYAKEFWTAVPTKTATGGFSNEFIQLYIAVRQAIESVTGSSKPTEASDYFLFDLPIYTSTFVITSWLAQIANDNLAQWNQAPANNFGTQMWSQAVKLTPFKVDFRDAKTQTDITPLAVDGFVTQLASFVKLNGVGGFNYNWDLSASNLTLEQALRTAISKSHRVRAFVAPESFLRAILLKLSAPQGSTIGFLQWELIPNFLTRVNQFLSIQTDSNWNILADFLFNRLGLGSISDDTKQALLAYYPTPPELQSRVQFLLNSFPVVANAAVAARNRLPFLNIYVSGIRSIAPVDIDGLSDVVHFTSNQKLLSAPTDTNGSTQPKMRPLYEFLANPERTVNLAQWLGNISATDETDFLTVIRGAASPTQPVPFSRTLDVAKQALTQRLAGTQAWIDRWRTSDTSWIEWVDGWEPKERRLLRKMVKNGDFEKFWNFFMKYGSISSSLKLVTELKQLSTRGSLRDALTLLTGIRNDRMQLFARTLLDTERSGETMQALGASSTILNSLSQKRP